MQDKFKSLVEQQIRTNLWDDVYGIIRYHIHCFVENNANQELVREVELTIPQLISTITLVVEEIQPSSYMLLVENIND